MKIDRTLFENFGCVLEGHGDDPMNMERHDIRDALAKYGAILFKGFNVDLVKFKEFTDRCCTQFMTHMGVAVRGRFSQFSDDTTITEVTVGENDLALHGEMYHGPDAPEVIWFFCEYPALIGGETTLADAHRLYNELPLKVREIFDTKKLKYRHCDPPQVWQPRYGTHSIKEAVNILKQSDGVENLNCDEKDNIIYDYITSAVRTSKYDGKKVFLNNLFITRNPANSLKQEMLPNQVPKRRVVEVEFEDDTPLTDELLLEVFNAGTRITQDIIWQPKDFVMVDNTRLLHGRRAFKGKRVIATRIVASV